MFVTLRPAPEAGTGEKGAERSGRGRDADATRIIRIVNSSTNSSNHNNNNNDTNNDNNYNDTTTNNNNNKRSCRRARGEKGRGARRDSILNNTFCIMLYYLISYSITFLCYVELAALRGLRGRRRGRGVRAVHGCGNNNIMSYNNISCNVMYYHILY